MNKFLFSLLIAVSFGGAYADDLLSAQVAYQQVLKEYNTQKGQTVQLSKDLENARSQVSYWQTQVKNLEEKYQAAEALQNTLETQLQSAGTQLDNAWNTKKQ